ncbi:unnamed protein product [Phytomonas sp. Hart1]|nr:unnamed protein product [Phytomonas sp. Hart1]|eukprot:CCW66806.1 unnamed protein product [Phytomonas sp. isolate Hart1]
MTSYERSVRFTNSDDSSSMRVYVNNMNVRHATVTLPKRRESDSFINGNKSTNTSPKKYSLSSNSQRISRPVKESLNEQRRIERATGHSFGSNQIQQRAGSPLGTVNSRHAFSNTNKNHETNMDKIYQRIMQRLQHEMNYNDLERIPLYDEYRVDLDMKELAEKLGDENMLKDFPVHSVISEERTNPSGSRFESRKGSVGSSNAGKDEKNMTSSSEVLRGPSRNSVYNNNSFFSSRKGLSGPRRNLHSSEHGLSGRNSTQDTISSKISINDVEKSLTLQPCPLPLQLVIQYVQKTILEKMVLAETGSLENCLRFVFESRALLDRLLREIPTYSSFPHADLVDTGKLPYISRRRRTTSPTNALCNAAERGGNGGDLPNMRLHELFQKFNKNPVLLPRGRFVQDEETGAVCAELDRSQEVAMRKVSSPVFEVHASISRPLSASQIQRSSLNVSNSNSPMVKTIYDMYIKRNRETGAETFEPPNSGPDMNFTRASEPEIQLPSSYGKSSRLRKEADNFQSQHKNTRRTQRMGAAMITRKSDTTPLDPFSTPTAINPVALKTSQAPGAGLLQSQGNPPALEGSTLPMVEKIARQKINVATMTEITDDTQFVSLAEYKKLEDQNEAIRLELEESSHACRRLAEDLQNESSYTERRAHIIQYLRETLMQECTLLRRQLVMPMRREPRPHNSLLPRRVMENGNTIPGASSIYSGHEKLSGYSTPTHGCSPTQLGGSLVSRSIPMGLSRTSAQHSMINPGGHGLSNGNLNSTLMDSNLGRRGTPQEHSKHPTRSSNLTGSGTQPPHLPMRDSTGYSSSNHDMGAMASLMAIQHQPPPPP